MEKLKIEYVDINSISPYENNAREHSEEQIEQIKKSILSFGNNDPIGVWHNVVVEGHGRLMALQELGYKEIPIIRLDDLTDEQRKAYTLAHNKLTDSSTFNFDKLEEELLALQETDINMSEFGFDNFEDVDIDSFFTDKEEEKEKKVKTITCPHCGEEIEV